MPQVPVYEPNQVANNATLKGEAEPLPSVDFGTQLAEGGQSVADALDKQSQIFDEAAAKQLTDQYSAFRQATLYGPSGLDKQQGQTYLNALPNVQKQLQDQRDQIIGQATTQRQRMMLTDVLNNRVNADLESTSSRGDTELRTYNIATSAANRESDKQQFQATYDSDPALAFRYLNNARTELVRSVQSQGLGDAVGAQEMVKLQTDAYGGVVNGMLGSQRSGDAVQFLHAHKGEMDPTTWDQLEKQASEMDATNSATIRNAGILTGMTGGGGGLAGATPPAAPDGLKAPTGTPYAFVTNIVASQGGDAKAQHDLAIFKLLESGASMDPADNGSSHGIFQFHPDTFKKAFPGGDYESAMDQTKAAFNLYRQNRAALTAVLGREPTTMELYMAHQQGIAGMKALLEAPPDVSAVAALTPAYRAHGAAAAAWAQTAVVKNGGSANMTAGQFLSYWQNRAAHQLGAKVQATTMVGDPAAPNPITGISPELPSRDVYMEAVQRAAPDPSVDPRGYRESLANGESLWVRANEAQHSREEAAVASVQPLLRDPSITTYGQFVEKAGPRAMAILPQGTQTTIYEHFHNMSDGGLPKVSDRPTVSALHDLYTDSPQAFARLDLTKYSDRLNNEDWEKLRGYQDAVRQGKGPDKQVKVSWDQISSVTNDIFSGAGYHVGTTGPGAKASGPDKIAYSNFKTDLLSRVTAWQAANPGKAPDLQAIRGMAAELVQFRAHQQYNDGSVGRPTSMISLDPKTQAYMPQAEIPVVSWNALRNSYIRRHGQAPTKGWIEQNYPWMHAQGIVP